MPHFAGQAGVGAAGGAGSGAAGLGKALAIRVTSISTLGQPLCHPDFGLFFLNHCVGAAFQWLNGEDAWPQHAKLSCCCPLYPHRSLPPGSRRVGKGQQWDPHPSLSMAAQGKGSFTHALPALLHAHTAGQTQILVSHPKNMALGALCADRCDVWLCGDAS